MTDAEANPAQSARMNAGLMNVPTNSEPMSTRNDTTVNSAKLSNIINATMPEMFANPIFRNGKGMGM
jgi:hypothetical protein